MSVKRIAIIGWVAAACVCMGGAAFAQVIPAGVCTTDPTFNISNSAGLVKAIIDSITNILYGPGGVANTLFTSITTGNGFFQAIASALALYIIIYGISFTLGIVQVTVVDFALRVVKFGVVMIFIQANAWEWFYGTVGMFFHQGANWLIGVAIAIAGGAGADPNNPFGMVDAAVAQALSPKMFVTFMATLTTGPYGLLIALLMLISIGTFVAALFQAIWVYLMALVVRAFLFGIAPVFIPMLLFSKTQHLFFNWLNQLVNTMLQPVFLFTFFSFFLTLIMVAMQNILKVSVCVMPGTGLFRGTPMDEQLWRFTVNGAPYGGAWGWNGPVDFPGMALPINIVDVLTFLLLVQLAWRFNSVAINVAKEISSASINLNMSGAFSSTLNPGQRFNPQLPRVGGRPAAAPQAAPAAGAANPAAGAGGAANAGVVAQHHAMVVKKDPPA